MKRDPDVIPAGTRIGKYEVIRMIGAGGMGAVYEALHVDLRKRVALKTLHPDLATREIARQRFLREGEAACRIRHPHVVDMTDVDIHDGMPFLVMEFMEGLDLKQFIVQRGPLYVEETLDLMIPIVAAVAAGHDEGVIHRDLKPHNIFLSHIRTGDVVPKVLDFGVSKLMDPATGGISLTGTAAVMGTVAYMSPEQARGAKFVDGRTDQYALALILYECLTGKRPHRGDNTLAILRSIGDGNITPPSELVPTVPPGLEEAILKGLSVDQTERFPSLYHFGRVLLPFASARIRAVWESNFAREPRNTVGRPSPDNSADKAAETVAAKAGARAGGDGAGAGIAIPTGSSAADRGDSTLGASAAEKTAMVRPARRIAFIAGTAVVATLLGVGGFVTLRKAPEASTGPAAAPAPSPAPPVAAAPTPVPVVASRPAIPDAAPHTVVAVPAENTARKPNLPRSVGTRRNAVSVAEAPVKAAAPTAGPATPAPAAPRKGTNGAAILH